MLFPKQWKTEYQVAIPKSYPPETEDDLRNIAKTQFLSKVYESFVSSWLFTIIQPYLDTGQCGLKGFSITHYLIKLLHFIHSTLDLKKPHSVLAVCVDISKAFNRIDHSLVIQDLYVMHTPAWLLSIIASYLTERSMVLTYNGSQSSRKSLPGGGPQGAFLGGIIFIVNYNGAFLRPPVPRLIKGPVNKSKAEKVEFVDDGTVAVSIDLKQSLIPDPEDRTRPLNYFERTGHILPPENNLLQFYITDAEKFMIKNKLVVNQKKTNVLNFTNSRKWSFPPEVKFTDGTLIECVRETKLVGVVLSDDLSWHKNTKFICQKARRKIWILRRMVELDLDPFVMLDIYHKEVRSIVEMAVSAWHPGLTKIQTKDIERIQKMSFKIILGQNYVNYEHACNYLSEKTLEEWRQKLCLKFAQKNLKSDNSFFETLVPSVNTRHKSNIVREFKCRTTRYQNSSLSYLVKLLNNHSKGM